MSGPGDNKTYDANGVMASVYDPALRALRISSTGSSGAPTNASYVTMVAESGLSNESVLGSAVIMTGTLGARPAAATAGRLYAATDNGILYRDTGSVWSAIGSSLTGAVILDPATSARNVIQGTADDVTELTLKKFAGQQDTVPSFLIVDENGNVLMKMWREMEFVIGDAANGLVFYGKPSFELGQDHVAEGLVTSTNDNGKYIEAGLTARANDDDSGSGYLGLQGNIAGAGAAYFSLSGAAATMYAQAVIGQTSPLLALRDENGNNVTRATPNGTVISNAHTEPADGDLNNSDCALWLKDTVAANAVNFKAKDSAGTVVTRAYAIKPIESHTATVAFGALAVGTPLQNTLGYDIMVSGTVNVTAATAGSVKLGVGPTSTPTTDAITGSITTAALAVVAFSAVVPNNYYVSLQSAGTITLASPVIIAVPV